MIPFRSPGSFAPLRAGTPGTLPVPTLFAVCALLAGCVSYEPRPLDEDAHRLEWSSRTLESEALVDFLERLESSPPAARSFDPDDGLQLAEGQLVAMAFHPRLRLERMRAGLAATEAEHAGAWIDPQFGADVLRVADDVPQRWVFGAGLELTLPLSGRLEVEADRAAAAEREARGRLAETEWEVWCDVREAWLVWSALDLRLAEEERLTALLEEPAASARRLVELGELGASEAGLFGLEFAGRRAELRRTRTALERAEEELRAALGLAPAASVVFVAELVVEVSAVAVTELSDRISASHPSIARARRAHEVAEESLRLEVRRQIPDLTLGPHFESEQGQSRWGLLGAWPVPLWNANRAAIARATVERELARVAFEVELEGLRARAGAARVELDALGEERAYFEGELLPLVDEGLERARALFTLGEGSTLVLLESFLRAHDARMAWIDLRHREARAAAELERWLGPTALSTAGEAQHED